MDLSLDRPEGYLFVRRVGANGITLIDRELTDSFLLAPDRAVEHWPVHEAGTLGAEHVEAVLALQPELVLLGTGARQAFPPAAFMAGFLRKGIGVEAMDNAAAARTYNLLAGEGRRVVAAFILQRSS
ncbi:Mth938-like domain-containing protein [Rhodanobacter sp. DHB23]|uniref:Mth938-like domain-containing protein n=1 Tax=Rhodanobacter sp. DHB23 TaxID=2775923 RepID=UPI001780D229|nr:Mth938-like domain-containing protein [Rhodanobacter sp. DHB23]MBD8873511.1 Mth938-like domain-containing protein [Rhodanobacter sp. DHB23]